MSTPTGDLRARRRARTREQIQDAALALFAERGYDDTTVDEVAAAAGVSPATFYRHFPRKEDVVVYDRLDAPMLQGVADAPADLRVAPAILHSITSQWEAMAPADREREGRRIELALSIPDARASLIDGTLGMIEALQEAIVTRADVDPDDPRPRLWAGACVGAMLAQFAGPLLRGELRFGDYVDGARRALTLLDEHLPF